MAKYNWDTINKYVDNDSLITNKHPNHDIWTLNYSRNVQFNNSWDDLTLASRGLVVDKEGNVIARPFPKFFNLEELNPSDIPQNMDYEIFEKMDGSLGIFFFYEGEWLLATRGSFTSEQAIKGREILANKISFDEFNPDYTYLFEIIYPENRIVVDYGDREDMVLIAIIETKSGRELPYEELLKFRDKIGVVKRYDNIDITDLSDLKKLQEENREGFIVKFKNGFRLKVKFDDYVRLHKILTNITARSIWEALSNGVGLRDIIDNVPDEFYDWVKKTEKELTDGFSQIEREARDEYTKIVSSLSTPKNRAIQRKGEFAMKAKQYKYPNLLFSMYDGKNYRDAIWKMLKPPAEKPFMGTEE